MRAFYDTESGRNVYEDELRAEFDQLRELDPETYSHSFERYIDNCTGKNGTLTEVEVDWFVYDTLWLVSEIATYLDERGIRFEKSPVNHLFWRFRILAAESQIANLKEYIARR